MKRSVGIGVLAVAALAVAPGAVQGASTKVTITSQGPGKVVSISGKPLAGYTTFVFKNAGKKRATDELVRLKPGVTPAQFFAAAQKTHNTTALQKYVTFLGGSGGSPSYTVTLNLIKATYLIIDVTKAAKLAGSFTVSDSGSSTAPRASSTITTMDYMFMGSMSIPAHGVVKIVNDGPSPHFVVAFKTKDKTAAQQIITGLRTGKKKGLQKLVLGQDSLLGLGSPRTTSYVQTDLSTGTWVIACFYSDPRSKGKDHARLGMEHIITVK